MNQLLNERECDCEKVQNKVKHDTDGMSPLHSLIECTIILGHQFKIIGQIEDPDQKDKLNYTLILVWSKSINNMRL